MAGLWYRVGTVTLTNGSKAVVGYGTKWKSANPLPGKGSMLCGPDGKVYEVDTVADDTNMTLVSNYTGPSGAGQGYALVLMALTIPQFSTQLSQFVQKNSLFASQINTLLTATGDVNLTDPDSGLVIKVPSWSKIASEGEGQAARAKVEADKAAVAAAVAVNVVREVSLPFPDVWLPLNDSPLMLAGHGVEVKVGAAVIAKLLTINRLSNAYYRDKNRVLRKVAENQFRFERWGMLVEGRQTNLITNSWNFMSGYGSARCALEQVVPSPDPDGLQKATTVTKNAAGSAYLYLVNTSYPAGKTYTWSIFAKAGTSNKVRLAVQAGVSGQAKPLEVDFNLDDGTWARSPVSGTYGSAESVKYADGWWRLSITCEILVSAAANHTFVVNVSPDDNFGSMHIWGFQCEEGNGMSSYIPTNGQTATRDADLVTLQRQGNDNYFGPFTLAMEVHCNARLVPGTGSDARRGLFAGYPSLGAFEVLMIDSATGRAGFAYGGSSFSGGAVKATLEDGGLHQVVAQCDSLKHRVYVDGEKAPVEIDAVEIKGGDNGATGVNFLLGAGAGAYTSRQLNGHIRNLRIWHHALSDSQCKAIR